MSGEGGFVPVAVDAVIPRLYAVCEKLHSKGWKLREAVVWEIEASLYALLDVTVSDEDAAKKLQAMVEADAGVPAVIQSSCDAEFQKKMGASPIRYPVWKRPAPSRGR